jgi:hypothetical protein
MSIVQNKITKLQNFIARNPAQADSPIGIAAGKYITPRTALQMLQRGQNVNAVISALNVIGVDPPQQDWSLVEEYYMQRLQQAGRKPKIYRLPTVQGHEMTDEEALQHIRAKDAIGQELLRKYQKYLQEMGRRMEKA